MSVSTWSVCWNGSTTASLEGERLKLDKISLSSKWYLGYKFLDVSFHPYTKGSSYICVSKGPSVGPSVDPSVNLLACRSGKISIFDE